MRVLKYTGSCFLLLGLFSCKKEKLITYNTEDNIYFKYTVTNNFIDTANFSFGYSPLSVQDSVFRIPVFVTGAPADHDRVYKVAAVPEGTTAIAGTNYVLPSPAVFRAGRVTDTLTIKFLRAANLQQGAKKLQIRLLPSEELKTGITSFSTIVTGELNILNFRFNISDEIGPGNSWTGVFQTYFGNFSVKKVRLINTVAGMPLDYYTTGWLTDLNLAARAASWAIFMSRYLADQKAAGNTILDEDGTEMMMGPAYR
jgi:hypothetical protein